jgi:hypothetical protein
MCSFVLLFISLVITWTQHRVFEIYSIYSIVETWKSNTMHLFFTKILQDPENWGVGGGDTL